ncbi:MAG: hypothetical protein ACREXG_08345, partial [Polaromonas sp.]
FLTSHYITRFFRIVTLGALTVVLSACSKTVTWEEEVPLNTGEMIWVKRTAVYTKQGGAGNPLDVAYRLAEHKMEFQWAGKEYTFQQGGVMVLAISPTGQPVLVGQADAGAWDAVHNYKCTFPFYVQFVPDVSGKTWTWPAHIEPWLYNLPTNLFRDFGTPEGVLPRYTAQQKRLQPYLADPRSVSMQKIDPAYTGDLCKRKEK